MIYLLNQYRPEGVTPLRRQPTFLELLRQSLEPSGSGFNHRIGRYRESRPDRPVLWIHGRSWIIDVLPDELAGRTGELMDSGLAAIKRTLGAAGKGS